MKIPVEVAGSVEECSMKLHQHFDAAWGGISGKPYFVINVPLRICPLGAHSDHQGGVVTGLTIDRSVQLLGRVCENREAHVVSANFDGERRISLLDDTPRVPGDWGNYLRGSIRALTQRSGGLSRGFKGVIRGAMPIGGLSSSAAVTIAYIKALEHVNALSSSPLETIMLVRAVENGYLGLDNGILDQAVILSGTRNSLTCIDCSSHTITTLPQQRDAQPWEILVVYSGLSRQLTATPFNQRVAECRQAARELLSMASRSVPEVPTLGEVGAQIFAEFGHKLPDNLRRRAAHFFTEAERVGEGMPLWGAGDMERFGSLVTASGESSITQYESGSPALISLYEILAETSGVYGTRFCGGGFQGCCLALINPRERNAISETVHAAYTQRHPELADKYSLHFCRSSDSVSVEVFS